MGTYTNNFNFFKAGDMDFVDVDKDLNNNLTAIDELLFEQVTLSMNGTSFNLQSIPTYKNRHIYSSWDGGIRVWDNTPHDNTNAINFWQPTHASPQDWQPLTPYLYSAWKDVPGFKSYFRISKEDAGANPKYGHLELRGRISLGTGFTAVVQNTVYQITYNLPNMYAVTLPGGGFGANPLASMGNSPASTTIWNRAFIDPAITSDPITFLTTGMYLTAIRKCGVNGVNTQTNGNTENYICLDGIRIPISVDGTG